MSDIVTYVLYIVAVFHGVAFVLESVGWALTPLGRRLILKVNPGLEEADIPEETTSSPWAKAQMRTLRIFYANMGVYNLMLALLAAYALVLHAYGADPGAEQLGVAAAHVAGCAFAFALVAGLVLIVTVRTRAFALIGAVQAAPGLVGLLLLH